MSKFNVDKKGYNIQEVDEYVNNLYLKYEDKLAEQKDRVVALKNEVETLNEKLSGYSNKENQISKALIFAVEKAEQIENNAKAVYNLELKRINDLYNRWENLLLEIEEKCPEINSNKYINKKMLEFKNEILEVSSKNIAINSKSIKDELKRSSDDFIKNILNRMDYVVNAKPISIVSIKNKADKLEELKDLEVNKPKMVTKQINTTEKKSNDVNRVLNEKPKFSMDAINDRLNKLSNFGTVKTKGETMADKYLNSEEDIKINAYAKNFAKKKLEKKASPFNYAEYPEPNESGFDLKEALNPKENLDEIMKSFDFFEDDKKNN